MKSILVGFLFATTLLTVTASAQVAPTQTLAQGTFQDADAHHHTQGAVQIEQRGDRLFLILDNSFKTTQGPALGVVLRDSTNKTSMMIVAELQNFAGRQEYTLNIGAAMLQKFDQVIIYCIEYHVDFGTANLH